MSHCTDREGIVLSPYTEWIKQPVLLQVKVENYRTTLRGIILGESAEFLQFRGWKGRRNIAVHKSSALAVEQVPSLQLRRDIRSRQSTTDWQVSLAS
jgi:hypothetical protein